MFRLLPLPDLNSINIGAPQNTYNPSNKHVEGDVANSSAEQTSDNNVFTGNQQNPDLSKVTIFASLDGDSSGQVSKIEAEKDIDNGIKRISNPGFNQNASAKLNELTGFSDFNAYLDNLYSTATSKYKEIDSMATVMQGEDSETIKNNLENKVKNNLTEQINAFNNDIQNKYDDQISKLKNALNEEAQQIKQQKEEDFLANSNLQMNNGVLINNGSGNKLDERGEFSRHGSNVSYTTDGGTKYTIGSKGASVQTNNFSMGANFKKMTANASYNNGKFSASIQQNLKNGSGSINLSYKFG